MRKKYSCPDFWSEIDPIPRARINILFYFNKNFNGNKVCNIFAQIRFWLDPPPILNKSFHHPLIHFPNPPLPRNSAPQKILGTLHDA